MLSKQAKKRLILGTVAVVEPVSEPVETHWYDDRPDYNPAVIDANDNFFGIEIYGIKYDQYDEWYTMYDDNGKNIIFKQEICTPSNLRLDLDLSSDQYGSMISVTMETIDLDQDGAMDKVAVKYVGTDGVLEFEREYHDGWDVATNIAAGMYNGL